MGATPASRSRATMAGPSSSRMPTMASASWFDISSSLLENERMELVNGGAGGATDESRRRAAGVWSRVFAQTVAP